MAEQTEIKRRYPRESRTPTDEAFYIIASVSEYFDMKLPEMPEDAFHKGVMQPCLNADYPSGDKAAADIRDAFDGDFDEAEKLTGVFMMLLAVHYAMDAIRAEKAGALGLAWTMVSDAQFYRGLLLSETRAESEVTLNARKAAKASHRENHALRADLFAWCEQNFASFPSVSKAAEAATKVVPMSYRTLCGWITLWNNIKSSEK